MLWVNINKGHWSVLWCSDLKLLTPWARNKIYEMFLNIPRIHAYLISSSRVDHILLQCLFFQMIGDLTGLELSTSVWPAILSNDSMVLVDFKVRASVCMSVHCASCNPEHSKSIPCKLGWATGIYDSRDDRTHHRSTCPHGSWWMQERPRGLDVLF